MIFSYSKVIKIFQEITNLSNRIFPISHNRKMRRNSLIPNQDNLPVFKSRRPRTYFLTTDSDILNTSQSPSSIMNKFIYSQTIIRDFLEQTLINLINQKINQKEIQKIVQQSINQCVSLFKNQNCQINPKGPFLQIQNQQLIQLDQEPKAKSFDPILGFQKIKKYHAAKFSSRNSQPFTTLKINHLQNQHRSNFSKTTINNQSATHRIILSKQIVSPSQDFPKLIPLKLQNIPNTPEGSYRRNLQDFLRQKKINAEINLGQKIKYFDRKENHGRKNIQQFSKSNFVETGLTNETFYRQNFTKLPTIFTEEDVGMDFDGSFIALKKITNPKRSAQILKTVCKVKDSVGDLKKVPRQKKRLQDLRLKAPIIVQEISNLVNLSGLINTETDMKQMIEDHLKTNKLEFRQILQKYARGSCE